MAEATRPYRPSNGAEGERFMAAWCARCERDRAFREDGGDGCPIAASATALAATDPNYPTEWVTGASGPRCTAFRAERSGDESSFVPDARQAGFVFWDRPPPVPTSRLLRPTGYAPYGSPRGGWGWGW